MTKTISTLDLRVAGFDVRAHARSLTSEPPGLVMGKSIRIDEWEWRPATMDSGVWPRFVAADRLDLCNGVNLFTSFEQASASASRSPDVRVVAFAFPASILERVAKTFGISEGGPEPKAMDSGWARLGYDVVDIRTQSSAFYSFDWSRDEWIKFVASEALRLNGYGLLDAEDLAVASAVKFDQRIAAHAPFAPCAIWQRI